MVSTDTEGKLEGFINHMNSLNTTIKFTHEFSKSYISFLDVTVSLDNNNKISIDLFVKLTNCSSIPLKSFCYPSQIKNPYLSVLLYLFVVYASLPTGRFRLKVDDFYANGDSNDSTSKGAVIKYKTEGAEDFV